MEVNPSAEEQLMTEGFPTAAASKLTGVSIKTLENWDTRGFLKPSVRASRGRGLPRVYSFRDLIAIRVALDLRQSIDVRNLRRVVDYLRKRKGLELSTSDVLASTSLVTDGDDVYEVTGDVSISMLRRPGQRLLLMVPLDELVAQLQAKARALRAA
jgi:DNA-binding transcriptional MerR regulator